MSEKLALEECGGVISNSNQLEKYRENIKSSPRRHWNDSHNAYKNMK